MILEKYNDLINDLTNLWYSTDINILELNLKKYSINDKNTFEKSLIEILENIFNMINNFPNSDDKHVKWAKEFNNYILEKLNDTTIDKNNTIQYFINQGFLEATKDFIKKSENSYISIDETGQAIRNAWIMNVLQIISDIKVVCSDSVYAYSMLYPLTDNFIDGNASFEEKKQFNKKLTKKLKGYNEPTSQGYQNDIFNMIDKIEHEYDRNIYPDVFESLLLIQKGQCDSLMQQHTYLPYQNDILSITFAKGGASVLADGYLINGYLSNDMINFSTLFGICLQLCDDIIDIQSDINSNHSTIFTLASKYANIDILAIKALSLNKICFSDYVNNLNFDNKDNILSFMAECCNYMIIIGTILNKKYFSKEYIKQVEQYIPISAKFINKINKIIKKRMAKINKKYSDTEKERMYNLLLKYFMDMDISNFK